MLIESRVQMYVAHINMQLFRSCHWIPATLCTERWLRINKNSYLWLAATPNYTFSCKFFTAFMQWYRKGLQHSNKHIRNAYSIHVCFSIHLFIMQISPAYLFLSSQCMRCRGEQFNVSDHHHSNGKWQAFCKTWRVNFVFFVSVVCFIAFDSTLKWVTFEFSQIKIRILSFGSFSEIYASI